MIFWRLWPYVLGALRTHRGASVASLAAIALGVALGTAVSAVNRSALEEFDRGLRAISGSAALEVRGGRAGFDESIYASLAAAPEVEAASAVLELDAKVIGSEEPLRLIGLDPLRAAALAPALAPTAGDGEMPAWLEPDTVFLSAAAAQALGVEVGATIVFQSGLSRRPFRVAGLLTGVEAGLRLAVTDIATAQWRFDRLGTLSRIDLAIREGVAISRAREAIGPLLPAGVHVAPPETTLARQSDASRAYRVNLDMLALVALFTGAFLVLSAQALSVVRRRPQLAFLRAAGVDRRTLAGMLVAEGVAVGAVGALLGTALGYAAAHVALRLVGGDLGAGYFPGQTPTLAFDAQSAVLYLLLGIAAAAGGACVPAIEAVRAPVAPALRAGDLQRQIESAPRRVPAVAALAAGAASAWLPPVFGLPVFGYLSVGLILLGFILCMPWVARVFFGLLPEGRSAAAQLAAAQLRHAPGRAITASASIVASVALAAAMAIMVASFRDSLAAWLDHILPADLYLRASRPGETGFLTRGDQEAIARQGGVARVQFVRHQSLILDPARPPVGLVARDLPEEDPASAIALISRASEAAGDAPEVWISEALSDLYGFRLGQTIALPIGGAPRLFRVAGVWRDYLRQHGAVIMRLADYRRLSADDRVSDAALWLAPGASQADTVSALRASLPGGDLLEIAERGQLRALSLDIFDRTFAVTYALEAVAIAIGLFGVAASFAASAQIRRREFGMLRHLGMSRGEIAGMIAREGAWVSALGVAGGLCAGGAISVVLIHVINRQSFHWSMDVSLPVGSLAAFAIVLVACASLTAVVSARHATRLDAVRAVREDW